MRNNSRIKVTAIATSIAFAISGAGVAIAEEATSTTSTTETTEATETTESLQTTSTEEDTNTATSTSSTETTSTEVTDENTSTADTTTSTASNEEDEIGLEAASTITTSDGTVLDLSNLNGYEPTVEELVDSLIGEMPFHAVDRDRLIEMGYDTSMDTDNQRYVFHVSEHSVLYYNIRRNKWEGAGGYDDRSSGTSDSNTSTQDYYAASATTYVSPTTMLTPATGSDYVSPTASAAKAESAIPATGDATSFAGTVAAVSSALGAFGGASALRRRK